MKGAKVLFTRNFVNPRISTKKRKIKTTAVLSSKQEGCILVGSLFTRRNSCTNSKFVFKVNIEAYFEEDLTDLNTLELNSLGRLNKGSE